MQSWETLSKDYTSPQGFIVMPVGNDIGLQELGEALRNGLMDARGRDHWAALCQGGARQIVQVADGNRIIANAELKVHQGSVRTMFVRGYDNVEFKDGSPEFDSVSSYVAAVNSREFPLTREPSGSVFDLVAQDHEVTSKWEEALQAARTQQTSPFAALLGGYDNPSEDLGDEVPLQTWTPLSGAFTKNGVTVEPVSNIAGLEIVGAELENALMIMSDVKHSVAASCRDGRLQVAAIYTEEDGLVAFAEMKVVNGQLLAASCRGYADEPPAVGVAQAVIAYVAAVNANTIVMNLNIGASQFQQAAPEEAFNPFTGEEVGYAGSSVPKAMRTAPGQNDGADYDDQYDDELDELDVDTTPQPVSLHWTGLTEPFTATNGLIVEPVTNQDALKAMGETMRNALATGAVMWATRCADGRIQIVRISSASEENGSTTVSNAELHVEGGLIQQTFNRGYQNDGASFEAEQALREYCTAVNEGYIPTNITVDEDGFSFDEPRPAPGMHG
jgi:hypothetical protein